LQIEKYFCAQNSFKPKCEQERPRDPQHPNASIDQRIMPNVTTKTIKTMEIVTTKTIKTMEIVTTKTIKTMEIAVMLGPKPTKG
jgi:hypothetical protein